MPGEVYYLTQAYETHNLINNPSAEEGLTFVNAAGTTLGWFNSTLSSFAQSYLQARYGIASVRAVGPGMGYYRDLLNTTWGTEQSFAVDMKSAGQTVVTIAVGRTNGTTFQVGDTLNVTLDRVWRRWELPSIAFGSLGSGTMVEIRFTYVSGATEFFIDGAGLEPGSFCSMYCDGDMPGCRWLTRRNAGLSYRPPENRTQGRIMPILETYGFHIAVTQGLGVVRVEQLSDELAWLPGSEYQGLQIPEREFALIGKIEGRAETGDPYKDLVYNRARLAQALRVTAATPAQLIFTGGYIPVVLPFRYNGGLEGGLQNVSVEDITVRGLANQPYWQELNQEIFDLDHQNVIASGDARYILKRVEGEWLSVAGSPNGQIRAIAHDPISHWTYFGGDFTTIEPSHNWTYAARHDGLSTYAVGTGGGTVGPDGPVYAILPLRDGKVLFCGDFLNIRNAGGTMSAKYVALFDPVALTWSTFGQNVGTGPVYAAVEDQATGDVFLGGDFDNWSGANGDNIVRVRKSDNTDIPVGVGLNNTVRALAWLNPTTLVIGGDFTASGATSLNYIAELNPSENSDTFIQVVMGTNVGMNGIVRALALLQDSNMAVGGDFTQGTGISASKIAIYTGSAMRSLGKGIIGGSASVRTILEYNDQLWIGGLFQAAGNLTSVAVNGLVVWTGGEYGPADVSYGGLATVNAIAANSAGDLWIGHNLDAGAIAAGYNIIEYKGTAEAFPIMVMHGPAGFYPHVITNWSLDHIPTVWFAGLQAQGAKDVVEVYTGQPPESGEQVRSNYRIKGLTSSIVPGSKIGAFFLRPGTNRISVRSSSAAAGSLFALRVTPLHVTKDTAVDSGTD